ncbi:glycosyltransferase family 2 protein [Ectorhizobium quercum]|uniref:glycosyltransferase family 2 protein n=1 Tax=Ectorhizobium quercum TaxID=2965071 RepID=UPI002795902D|nr:glycosyltransferase family 2 protein [Ectorhizobium quercum]
MIVTINDPDRLLGRSPTICLHRSGRTPAILTRPVLIDDRGRGRFFGWTPAGLTAISAEPSPDSASNGRMPTLRIRRPSYPEIACHIACASSFAALQTLRLLLAGNSKGFQYRFVRLFERLGEPRYADWLAAWPETRRQDMPLPAGHDTPPVLITITGNGARAELTRASIGRQTYPAVEEASAERVQSLVPDRIASSFLMRLPAGFTLEDTAIEHLVQPLLADSNVSAAYCDEDCIDASGDRHAPFFKPAWNPPLAATGWLPPEGVLVRGNCLPATVDMDGMYAQEMVQTAAARGDIVHVPRMLLHRDRARAPAPPSKPKVATTRTCVSVIIPTRDRADLLGACLEGLFNRTRADDIDVIVIDNGSREPETLALFKQHEDAGRIRRIIQPGSFNFSQACNLGAEAACHELLLLLNNDIEPIEPGWLDQMVAELDDQRIGAAGALLLFPDGFVQHAGATLGAGSVARHSFHFRHPDAGEDFGLLVQRQEVSAVTAACLLTRKSLWQEVHGMNEEDLAVSFNDVDYCLKLREVGKGIIWTPHARLIHRESVSRGPDDTREKIARFSEEERYMHERWGDVLLRDPFYHPCLSLTAGDRALDAAPRDLAPRRPGLRKRPSSPDKA